MKETSYGVRKQARVTGDLDRHVEELTILGFTILENVVNESDLQELRDRLDRVYSVQENSLGKENLAAINEVNLARCPLAYDDYFLTLATNKRILEIVDQLLGGFFVLHLQNGIINLPNEKHHQSSWHRDLPYQDFEISKPLALSALYCVDDFSTETGATIILPFSHRLDLLPSEDFIEKHQMSVGAPRGSVIVFDSMLYHRAGYNSSVNPRRAVNHVFTAGILKQQVDIPAMLDGKYRDDSFLAMLLGYDSRMAKSVDEYRSERLRKVSSR